MRRKLIIFAVCLCSFASVFAETNYKVSSSSRLNVRKTPSTSGVVLGTFKSGEEITVLSIKNGWAKVEFGKNIGYVSAKYIQELPQKVEVEPQEIEEVVEVEEVEPETTEPIYEIVSQTWSSSIITPVIFGKCMPSNMNLYFAGQIGLGWSNFLWNDGDVNGTFAFSVDVLAQLYFEDKVSFIPKNWNSELSLGYDRKGAADFCMSYIHLGIKPLGYKMSFGPVDVVANAGINLAFPLNDLETSTNSWSADFQCGVIGGVRVERRNFAIGCSVEYDFTEVSSSCNQTLNNVAVWGTLSYKFGKLGHKK